MLWHLINYPIKKKTVNITKFVIIAFCLLELWQSFEQVFKIIISDIKKLFVNLNGNFLIVNIFTQKEIINLLKKI